MSGRIGGLSVDEARVKGRRAAEHRSQYRDSPGEQLLGPSGFGQSGPTAEASVTSLIRSCKKRRSASVVTNPRAWR
jgi:hypothetical protein